MTYTISAVTVIVAVAIAHENTAMYKLLLPLLLLLLL